MRMREAGKGVQDASTVTDAMKAAKAAEKAAKGRGTTMTRSDSINELAAALAKAQSEMGTAARRDESAFWQCVSDARVGAGRLSRAALKNQLAHAQGATTLAPAGDGQWIRPSRNHAVTRERAISVRRPRRTRRDAERARGRVGDQVRSPLFALVVGRAPPAGDDDDGEAAMAPSAPRPKTPRSAAAEAPAAAVTGTGRPRRAGRRPRGARYLGARSRAGNPS